MIIFCFCNSLSKFKMSHFQVTVIVVFNQMPWLEQFFSVISKAYLFSIFLPLLMQFTFPSFLPVGFSHFYPFDSSCPTGQGSQSCLPESWWPCSDWNHCLYHHNLNEALSFIHLCSPST